MWLRRFSMALTLLSILLIYSCKDNKSELVPDSDQIPESGSIHQNTDSDNNGSTTIYAWVDKLRLRSEPNTRAEIIASLGEGSILIFSGDKTEHTEKISLRGVIYDEPWLKVATEEGLEGWVYGGGVKFYKPKIDLSKTPYDNCLKIIKTGRMDAAQKCLERIEQEQLAKHKHWVKKNETQLTILLRTGKELSFPTRSNPQITTEESTTFAFRTYLEGAGFFVLQIYDGSSGDYLLINDKTGNTHRINGYPKPSPNNETLVALQAYGSENPRYGIQLWSYADTGFSKVFQDTIHAFEVLLPKWLDTTTVEFNLAPLNPNENKAGVATLNRDTAMNWTMNIR